MDLMRISIEDVRRPWLFGAWIFAHLAKERLDEGVLILAERTLQPIKQFSFPEARNDLVELLVASPQAKRAIREAISTYRDELFDEDGYLKEDRQY